jgi:phytoene synthase
MPLSWLDAGPATAADLAACRKLLCGGSRSFYAASFLLPRAVHEPATALYAFCRVADDEIDLDGGRTDALGRLAGRLDRIYLGRPDPDPADRALAAVVAHFELPRTLLDALLEGFAWDAEGRRYRDLSSVYDYSARVAGTVGVMMAVLMGVRSPGLLARAGDLGLAMQLTNIARDVGEDARAGRLYLPEEWLREEGIEPDAWLARPLFSDAIGRVVRRLLRAADVLYEQADEGIAGLPLACRPGINAARFLYAEIGREVERMGCDSISRRAVVSGARKAQLLKQVLQTSAMPRRCSSARSLAETRFLVDSAAVAVGRRVHAQRRRAVPGLSLSQVEDRAVWVLDLFERLERRDRSRRAARLAGSERVAPAVAQG